MISNDTKFGYEKILGLRGDRQDRTKKRSLEARADAFSRLKKSLHAFTNPESTKFFLVFYGVIIAIVAYLS